MKKQFKYVLVLLLVVAQLFLLCGCIPLDEMRENQAFFDENGDILWNGSTYKLLPSSELLLPEIDYETSVWVTQPDVPVLLSAVMADVWLSANKDGSILESMYEYQYYCREELYDSLCARMENFTPDLVCYSYDVFDEENYEFDTQYYVLSQEQCEVIELVTQTVEPTAMDNSWYLDYEWSVYLEECSEDMLLRRNSLDIAVNGDTYYLLLYTDTQTLAFTVPDGCKAAFDEIVSTYLEKDYYQQYSYEDYLDIDI